MQPAQLRSYFYAPPKELAVNSKKKGAAGRARWAGRALIRVADLLWRHGVELRKVMKGAFDELPSAAEEMERLAERVAKLEKQLEVEKVKKEQAQAAHRQSSGRLKLKNKAATDARKHEHKKMLGFNKAQRKKVIAKYKATRKAILAEVQKKVEADAAKKVEAETLKLKKRVKAARKRARDVESTAKNSAKYLRRAKLAEGALQKLQSTLEEEESEDEDESGAETSEESDEEEGSSEKPARAQRDARGRFQAMPYKTRILIWAELSRRVAPSAVAANIVDVLLSYAPEVDAVLPCEREIKKMRGELTIASEAIASFRVALSKRIISFGFDESTKFGLSLLSTNTQIETQDGKTVDVVMRGATLTAGGTASALAWLIERKIFTHARTLLKGWKEQHESQHGSGSWAAAGGPDPESIGIHRLTDDTLVMSDTCNAARATKRLIEEAAVAAYKEKHGIGDALWDSFSQEERDAKCKVHIGECHQHLRNIIINAMQLKATEHLKEKLQDSLGDFSAFDRMTVDGNDLVRALYKELHAGGEYAKGKQREWEAWRKKHYPSTMFMPFERANGGRQDLIFDGSVPIFVNRKMVLEFLRSLIVPGADNQLEKFLWRVMSCNEMTALLRVNTLWKYIFSEPTRWLAGKSNELDKWSIDSSSRVLDLTEEMMVAVANDGHTLLDPSFDPFASIAEEQPAFKKWREEQQLRTTKAADGTRYCIHRCALSEARSPAGKGNADATEMVVELAEIMANAALVAMRDPKRAIASLLTSQGGELAAGKDAKRAKNTIGAHVTNDRVESNFGSMDSLMRMYRYATAENLSGIVQQMRNGDFERARVADPVRGRKRTRDMQPEQLDGFFHSGLTQELQQSLVEYARKAAEGARKDGRLALKEHDEEKLARREERLITMLNAAVDRYAYALELFDAWAAKDGLRAKSATDVERALIDEKGRPKPEAEQLEYLRHQIEMRVLGLGWSQYSTRWSSQADTRIGTVAHLTDLLQEILQEERSRGRLTPGSMRGLPTEAAPPAQQAPDLGQLGTLDADAAEITRKSMFSAEELNAKVEVARQLRIAQGIADPVQWTQSKEAPPFDQSLVGKQLEVLWKYFDKDTKEPQLIWATGRVARIADGVADKKTRRSKKLLPAGAVLWAWDADPEFDEKAGEQWLVLLPKKYNKQLHYSWRMDPRELGLTRATEAPEGRANMRRADK